MRGADDRPPMPGRKKPEMTEQERDHEYMLQQKRGYGEKVVGERGAALDDKGAPARVEREREEWAEKREQRSRHEF